MNNEEEADIMERGAGFVHVTFMRAEKQEELTRLLREYLQSYAFSSEAQARMATCEQRQRQKRIDFANLNAATSRGENLTGKVVLERLLGENPALKLELENSPLTGRTLLDLLRRCQEGADQFARACDELSRTPLSSVFQTGALSSVLNALRPDLFPLVGDKFLRVTNYFSDKFCSLSLADFPSTNAAALLLIAAATEGLCEKSLTATQKTAFLYIFPDWLCDVRKYELKTARFVSDPEMYKNWPPMW